MRRNKSLQIMKPKKRTTDITLFDNKGKKIKGLTKFSDPLATKIKAASKPNTDEQKLKTKGIFTACVLTVLKGKSLSQKKSLPANTVAKISKGKIKEVAMVLPEYNQKKKIRGAPPFVTILDSGSLGPRMNILKKTAMQKCLKTSNKQFNYMTETSKSPKSNFMTNKFAKGTYARFMQALKENPQKDKRLKFRPHIFNKKSSSLKQSMDQPNRIFKIFEQFENNRFKKPRLMLELIKALEEITPEQKKRILKSLSLQVLPEPKSILETKLRKKNCTQGAKPLESKTSALKKLYTRTARTSFMPRPQKNQAQKDTILHDLGVQLSKGRTNSEKSLISKIKLGSLTSNKSSLQKYRNTKLNPKISDKTSAEKEKIVKDIDSQRCSSNKTRTQLPKDDIAINKDLKTNVADYLSLEDKSPEKKRNKIIRLVMRGFLLPEKKTASKSKLTKKSDDVGLLVETANALLTERKQKGAATEVESERQILIKSILPSITGKQVEAFTSPRYELTAGIKKILANKIARTRLQSPDCKAALEELFPMIITMGPKSKPKTLLFRDIFDKETAVSTLVPVESLNLFDKEKILRIQTKLGVDLKGKTISEKILIAKLKAETKTETKTLSENVQKIKAAGLLKPLKGETWENKEKILKELIRKDLPLLEAKTMSEKNLISKIKADLGQPTDNSIVKLENSTQRADAVKHLISFLNLLPTEKS